jgi:hypothetical protein
MRSSTRVLMGITLITLTGVVQSQSAPQFIGLRVLKRVWWEAGLGVAITPVTSFDSGATGCSNYSAAILPFSHPNFKELYATLLAAYLSGLPIDSYVVSCQSAWGTTLPSIWNLGIGTP